jgi:hypothetical protein
VAAIAAGNHFQNRIFKQDAFGLAFLSLSKGKTEKQHE